MLAVSSTSRQGTPMTALHDFEIVGFDLDGTIVDSSFELAASLNHALEKSGRPPIAAEDVKQLVGMGARHMLEMALAKTGPVDRDEVRALMPILISHYEAHIGTNCPIFPGFIDAIEGLSQHDVALAVVTNKFEGLAVKLLDQLGLRNRFVTIIGGDTMGPGRGKPEPDGLQEMVRRCGGGRAAFVGDSIHDVHAAQAAGLPSIAVRFGFLHQPVESLGASAIIDHFDDLIPALAQIR
jgi:phosphoglycolate phosphatase